MRIIAGTARSLPLKTIEGMDTRPTTDRIKETLFNMIQQGVGGSYFLDLFAGSGQIGLEAISRGGAYAVFVENNKKAAACIEDNIRFTKFTDRCRLLTQTVAEAIWSLDGKYKFDYVFMDPPYKSELEREALELLAKANLLKEDSTIIVEAALDKDFSYVTDLGYEILKEKCYKTNKHVFMRFQIAE